MLTPSDHRPTFLPPPERHGPVTCAACGCRLQPVGPSDATAFFHFGSLGGRDARGCRVECADFAHDATGRPVPAAALA
jgi:hypothetical protein